jgi:hypothetical protein
MDSKHLRDGFDTYEATTFVAPREGSQSGMVYEAALKTRIVDGWERIRSTPKRPCVVAVWATAAALSGVTTLLASVLTWGVLEPAKPKPARAQDAALSVSAASVSNEATSDTLTQRCAPGARTPADSDGRASINAQLTGTERARTQPAAQPSRISSAASAQPKLSSQPHATIEPAVDSTTLLSESPAQNTHVEATVPARDRPSLAKHAAQAVDEATTRPHGHRTQGELQAAPTEATTEDPKLPVPAPPEPSECAQLEGGASRCTAALSHLTIL